MDAEMFSCPNCRTEIRFEDVPHTLEAVCPGCGNAYRLDYDDLEESYRLVSKEPPLYSPGIDTDRV